MAAILQEQQAQLYRCDEPTLSTLNAGWQELPFLPSNEATPSGRIKYEFVMKTQQKKRVESILDFRLICHLHSGTYC